MDCNLMKRAYCSSRSTTWSGLSGYSYKFLSYDDLLVLVDDNFLTGITVSGSQYVSVDVKLGRKFVTKEFRVYSSAPESNKSLIRILYKDSDNNWQEKNPVDYYSSGYFYWNPDDECPYGGFELR